MCVCVYVYSLLSVTPPVNVTVPRIAVMLLDFSEALQEDIFLLGGIFMKMCRLLGLKIPVVDPSLFIRRFASRLDFGTKLQQVVRTATKLVSGMMNDWISTGRRPAGICAAALLLAARINGFKRSHEEVMRAAGICDTTLRKRMLEFEETALAEITTEELNGVAVEKLPAADPPAFRLSQRKREIKEGTSSSAGGGEDEDMDLQVVSFSSPGLAGPVVAVEG